jgi:hypothetical protein
LLNDLSIISKQSLRFLGGLKSTFFELLIAMILKEEKLIGRILGLSFR